MTRIDEDRLVDTVRVTSFVLLGVASLAGYVFASGRFAAGVFAGGVLALANFYWLQLTLLRSMGLAPHRAGRFAQMRYLLRFCVVALVLYLLMVHTPIDIFGLITGLSIIVFSIMGLSLYMVLGKGE
uniref:ATP synthase subunit I n=1 Tax=Geobacter metallireducens TaxID=28232 RepID=A0A831UFJ7_GEOME